jgi:ABC-type antimicrobial peptide transport system permease subunit
VDAIAIAPGRAVLETAVIALWLGAAGAGLLAVLAIGAVVGAQLRARRSEVVILRAIGLDSTSLGALRRRELAIVLGFGLLVGLVAGSTVLIFAVGALARAAVPDAYTALPTLVRMDWIALGAGLLLIVGVLLAVIAAYGARVAAQARRTPNREDIQ